MVDPQGLVALKQPAHLLTPPAHGQPDDAHSLGRLLVHEGLHRGLGCVKEGVEGVGVPDAEAGLAVAEAPPLQDPLGVGVEPEHQAGQAHVGRDELETSVLVCTAPVLVALLVHFRGPRGGRACRGV